MAAIFRLFRLWGDSEPFKPRLRCRRRVARRRAIAAPLRAGLRASTGVGERRAHAGRPGPPSAEAQSAANDRKLKAFQRTAKPLETREAIVQFSEAPLPDRCPPQEAVEDGWESIYRLIDSPQPTHHSFKSNRALQQVMPIGADECRWAACSLVFDAKKQKKLPKFKGTHHWAAVLRIPKGAGMSLRTGRNHVEFWCGSHFDICEAVQTVVDV